MILSYGDGDIPGMDEANLTLCRLDINGWEVATCPNYEVQRFPQDNLLTVPFAKPTSLSCQTPPRI